MFTAGVRATLLTSARLAPLFLQQSRGLIVNTIAWLHGDYMVNLLLRHGERSHRPDVVRHGAGTPTAGRVGRRPRSWLHADGAGDGCPCGSAVPLGADRIPRLPRSGGPGACLGPGRLCSIRARALRRRSREGIRLHRHRRESTASISDHASRSIGAVRRWLYRPVPSDEGAGPERRLVLDDPELVPIRVGEHERRAPILLLDRTCDLDAVLAEPRFLTADILRGKQESGVSLLRSGIGTKVDTNVRAPRRDGDPMWP